MKKLELEEIMNNLKEISNVASRQDYNTSTAINKLINSITPHIKTEYERLNADKVELNCPRIFMDELDVEHLDLGQDIYNPESYVVSCIMNNMNEKLAELVSEGHIIIDYGIETSINGSGLLYYIKYTE